MDLEFDSGKGIKSDLTLTVVKVTLRVNEVGTVCDLECVRSESDLGDEDNFWRKLDLHGFAA